MDKNACGDRICRAIDKCIALCLKHIEIIKEGDPSTHQMLENAICEKMNNFRSLSLNVLGEPDHVRKEKLMEELKGIKNSFSLTSLLEPEANGRVEEEPLPQGGSGTTGTDTSTGTGGPSSPGKNVE